MLYRLTALLVLFFSTTILAKASAFSYPTDTLKKDTVPAQFPGGIDLFYQYLKTNTKFPIASRLKGVQGKVNLKFVVDTNGQVSNVKIKKGLDKHTNLEALRVVRQSVKWIPATINGIKQSFSYNIPIRFSDTVSLKGAEVMVNGNLLNRRRKAMRLNLDTLHYSVLEPKFATAIFGAKYNKKVVFFNDSVINTKGYNDAHFKYAFKMLQNIDTSKVQLNVADKPVSLNEWRKYLNKDSIVNISFYTAAVSRTIDKNKLGTASLITKAGIDKQKQVRQNLIQNIVAYRNGKGSLPTELVTIDNASYSTPAIYGNIDTNVIRYVNILPPADAVKFYGEAYKNGITYIYTKNYQANKQITDKQKLLELIAQDKDGSKTWVTHAVFLNNKPILLEGLSHLSASDIQYVNIISKEEAKAFFGDQEQRGIISVNTATHL
ncbi:energy transducer TonB [Pedobacter sp. UYP24]